MFTPAPADTPNVSCDLCHDPHKQSTNNPVGIRTGSAGSVCGTCHEKKWQNATLRGTAGNIDNGYHWDDYSDYTGSNRTEFNQYYHYYADSAHLRTMVELAKTMTVAPPVALLKVLEIKGGKTVYALKTTVLVHQGKQ